MTWTTDPSGNASAVLWNTKCVVARVTLGGSGRQPTYRATIQGFEQSDLPGNGIVKTLGEGRTLCFEFLKAKFEASKEASAPQRSQAYYRNPVTEMRIKALDLSIAFINGLQPQAPANSQPDEIRKMAGNRLTLVTLAADKFLEYIQAGSPTPNQAPPTPAPDKQRD